MSGVTSELKPGGESYRPNVGIILCKRNGEVLIARRINHDGWQFPQGGIGRNETSHEAAYRELNEELGLEKSHVRLMGSTKNWLKYDIPEKFLNRRYNENYRGQIQKWFLFEFIGTESDFCLHLSPKPEFDDWKWVEYWSPVESVVRFKRHVYQDALAELEQYLLLLKNKLVQA